MFIYFINFYKCFIYAFSRITILLTLILKATSSYNKWASKPFRADNNEFMKDNDGRANDTVVNLFKFNKSKNDKF